eukprot:2230986-Pyramimonas_sp.AAC.4
MNRRKRTTRRKREKVKGTVGRGGTKRPACKLKASWKNATTTSTMTNQRTNAVTLARVKTTLTAHATTAAATQSSSYPTPYSYENVHVFMLHIHRSLSLYNVVPVISRSFSLALCLPPITFPIPAEGSRAKRRGRGLRRSVVEDNHCMCSGQDLADRR